MNRPLHAQQGLTLIEIMVVLIILSLLYAFLAGGLFNTGARAKAKINGMKMQKLQGSIQEYQLMYNTLPPSLDALVGCTEETGAGCVPLADKDAILDAWNTPFQYQVSGKTYALKSLGADQRDGGSGADGDVTITGP